MRMALYPLKSGSSPIMSMEITCQHRSGTLLGISFPTFCIGKVFVQCRWGETQSRAPNQPNQIHTTPDTELRRSRTKKTKADLLYLVQQATDTSSIFSNQTFQPVT